MKKVILSVLAITFALSSNAQAHEKGKIHYEVNANFGVDVESEFDSEYSAIGMYTDVQFGALYNLTDVVSLGLGVGVGTHIIAVADSYGDSDAETFFTVPVMMKSKFVLGSGKVSFIGRLDGGIEFIAENESGDQTFVTHPQIGIGFNGSRSSFNLVWGIRSTFISSESISYATFGLGWAF